MNESDYHFITIAKFSQLTGILPRTACYYCDIGQLPHVVIAYGKKKKTRLVDYQEFLQLMEQLKKPVIPQRTDKRPARIRLLEMISATKQGRSQSRA